MTEEKLYFIYWSPSNDPTTKKRDMMYRYEVSENYAKKECERLNSIYRNTVWSYE